MKLRVRCVCGVLGKAGGEKLSRYDQDTLYAFMKFSQNQ